MTALPPFDAGGENVTTACAFPATAVTLAGAPGTPGPATGVTLRDALEVPPVPAAFVALTVKVYGVPLVSPVTVIGLDGPVAVMPPGLEVTV